MLTLLNWAIGLSIAWLGGKAILEKVILNSITEIHQQSNRKIIEEIKRDNQEKLEKIKIEYQKDIEKYKNELLKTARYSEYQFKLYNELWVSLYDLRNAAENLWEHADRKSLQVFTEQLNKTKLAVGRNSLLIEEQHYENLNTLLNRFGEFQIGKRNLISVRSYNLSNFDMTHYERDTILSNEQIKDEYVQLVNEIGNQFKNHIQR